MADADNTQMDTGLPDGLPEDPLESYNPSRTVEVKSVRIPAPGSADTMRLPESFDVDETEADFSDLRAAGVPDSAFKLRRIVGQGGFGEVWEAEQRSLRRLIAVKRIRDEMVDESQGPVSLRRIDLLFQQEALTTACLEHPNIVPVHELAIDDKGRPVMAMKLVKGRPWQEMITSDALMPDDAFLARHIPILIQVCQAVAFAHSRGVVHRDLKPSQVMVGGYGEVILMDWGLALAFDTDSLAAACQGPPGDIAPTLESGNSPAGTIAYMAPEQTDNDCSRVGPWTDVWLLGGILYYLLTLTPPHNAPDRTAAFFQARGGVVDPPAERVANRVLPADLCDLAMRALRPEPTERLQSALAFLEGLQAYLSGEGRRRESIMIAHQVTRELGENPSSYGRFATLDNQLVRAQGLWSENPEVPALRARVLEAYSRRALHNGDLILARAEAEALAPGPARAALLAEIVAAEGRRQAQRVQRLVLIAATAILLVVVTGLAIWANGRAREAVLAQNNADAARSRAVRTRDRAEDLLSYLLVDFSQDLESLGRLDLLESIAERSTLYYDDLPTEDITTEALRKRGVVLYRMGTIFHRRGDLDRALSSYETYGEFARQVLERSPGDTTARSDQAGSRMMIGQVLQERGEYEKAHQAFEEAASVMEALVADQPDRDDNKALLATTYVNASVNLFQMGRTDEALGRLMAAVNIYEELVAASPGSAKYADQLGSALNNAGLAQQNAGRLDDAANSFARSLELRRDLVERNPEDAPLRDSVARTLVNYSYLLSQLGRFDDAIALMREAVDIRAGLGGLDATNQMWQQSLTRARIGLAGLLVDAERDGEALELLAADEPVARELVANSPDNLYWSQDLARLLDCRATALRRTGDHDGALACYQEALAIRERLAQTSNAPQQRQLVASTLLNMALLERDRGDLDAALAHAERALAEKRWLHEDYPADRDHQAGVLHALRVQAGILSRTRGSGDRAGEAWREAGRLADEIRASGRGLTVTTSNAIAEILHHTGHTSEGRAFAVDLHERGAADSDVREIYGL